MRSYFDGLFSLCYWLSFKFDFGVAFWVYGGLVPVLYGSGKWSLILGLMLDSDLGDGSWLIWVWVGKMQEDAFQWVFDFQFQLAFKNFVYLIIWFDYEIINYFKLHCCTWGLNCQQKCNLGHSIILKRWF